MKEQVTAVIVEVRGRRAVALSEEGLFLRVSNGRYEIGQTALLDLSQTVEIPVRKRMYRSRFVSMVAGFVLLAICGLIGYMTPVGVVSLDVNPSIEYTINYFDRVLDVAAVNQDAASLLQSMDEQGLLYRPVDDALEQTVSALRENGYIAASSANNVVISAYSYDERHSKQIAQRLEARISKQSDLSVYSVPVTNAEVKAAHALGTSAGKQYMIERLGTVWGDASIFAPEDWINQPMRRILRETELRQKAQKLGEEANPRSDEAPAPTPRNEKDDKDKKDEEKWEERAGENPSRGKASSDDEQHNSSNEDGHTP